MVYRGDIMDRWAYNQLRTRGQHLEPWMYISSYGGFMWFPESWGDPKFYP